MEEVNVLEWLKKQKLMTEYIERDIKRFGLDENATITITDAEKLEGNLSNKDLNYGFDIVEQTSNPNNICVINAYNYEREENLRLSYYEFIKYNEDIAIHRKLEKCNKENELYEIEEEELDENGKFDILLRNSVRYIYDENGKKRYAKIETPMEDIYVIYDENEREEFKITDQYVEQLVKDGDKEYTIIDGHITPADNEYGYRFAFQEKEINRAVLGNISDEEKQQIIADLTEDRKKEVENEIEEFPTMSLGYRVECLMQVVSDVDYLRDIGDENVIWNPPEKEELEESIRKSVEKLRKSGRPYKFEQFIEDANLDKHIGRAYGGDEFLEKLLAYATKHQELTQKNRQAKSLLNEYEQQANKEGQIQSDD